MVSHMHFTTITIASSLRWLRFDVPCSKRSAVVPSIRNRFPITFAANFLQRLASKTGIVIATIPILLTTSLAIYLRAQRGLSADNQGNTGYQP